MQDIRKPYTRSRSNRNLYDRVEQFENGSYDDDRDTGPVQIPTKGGPRMRRNLDEMEMYPRRRKDDLQDDIYDDDIRSSSRGDGEYRDGRTRSTRRKGSLGTVIFILVVVALIAFALLFTFVFNKATVTIVPKHQDIDARKTITLTLDGAGMGVPYILASSSLSSSKALQLSESKKIEAKASGKIIVYNNFDTSPQRLIKNTRFESASGKVYRINDSITVPGKKGDTPGSVTVTVYADSYGADYNSDPTDFTIPGFKGTPRYAGFFGRSSGALSGGASGNMSLPALSDINGAKDELALELGQKIKEKLLQVKQDGYTALYSAIDIEYSDNEKDILQGKTKTYEVTATGYLMLADTGALTQKLAQGIRDYNNEPVRLENPDSLTYSIKDTVDLSTSTTTEVLVEGTPTIVWVTSTDEIQRLFAGKKRDDFKNIMEKISSIESGEISFSPLWLSTFPSDLKKIKIVEKLPKSK